MVENKKCIAFIPVRGGSKSIPLKNIKIINGRPLVYWTIDAAINCKKIDKVYVSTDDLAIRNTVSAYKQYHDLSDDRLVCVERSAETATDTASTESAMLEFAENHDFGIMVLIQATSPLLQCAHLNEGLEKFEQGGFTSLLSVVRQKRFIWSEDYYSDPVNYDYNNRPRRQEFNGFLVENGAFYVVRKEDLLRYKCRLCGKVGTFEMPEETYFEIDEPSDWVIIEHFLSEKEHQTTEKTEDRIKLFATDCDGCLTDGGMYYSESGDESKKFNTKDGMGFALLREANIKTAIITGEETKIVFDRAKKIKVDYLYQGVKDKLSVLKEIALKEGIDLSQIAYMGDDINDIEALKNCGYAFTVPAAVSSVKQVSDRVVKTEGGSGAVREAIEFLLNERCQ